MINLSILFNNTTIFIFCQTKNFISLSVPIIIPSTASTTSTTPSQIVRAEQISSEKFTCPGVSNAFMTYDLSLEFGNKNVIGLAFIESNLSISSNLESVYR